MKENNFQLLNPKNITSEVFIISPTQIDAISKKFGDEMAIAMNVRPLAKKIQQIAVEVLTQTLRDAKNMGE